MKVFLARLGIGGAVDEPLRTFEYLQAADRFKVHLAVDDPANADIILFTQCHMLSDRRLRSIARHPLTQRYPDKVRVYDERDRPTKRYPGLYVSQDKRWFDASCQSAWAYARVRPMPQATEADLLFSFIGSRTTRCRGPLYRLQHEHGVVDEVRGFTFFDPTSTSHAERWQRYEDVMRRSRFVICPRGRGTSSFRLYEALSLGRVPVIISDAWVPPEGPAWESFSIRWPEGKVDALPAELEERDEVWPEMSRLAQRAYDEFFAPEVAFHRMMEELADLGGGDRPTLAQQARWAVERAADDAVDCVEMRLIERARRLMVRTSERLRGSKR